MVNLDDINDLRSLARRRLVRWMLVTIAAGLAAASPTLGTALLPEPDFSRLLFTELAQSHYRATSTSTVVKEFPDVIGLFAAEYNKRNAHRGQPPVELPPPRGLWSYSYVPGGLDLTEHTYDELFGTKERPSMLVTEPSDPPVAVWIYSREQNALVVFLFERLIHDVFEGKPPTPDPRMFLDYDASGTVAAFGPAPMEKLIYTHAWLLPLGDVTARDLLLDASPRRADVLDRIPYVVEMSAREEFTPPIFSGAPVGRAREQVRRPALYLRLALLLVMLGAAFGAGRAVFALVRLRREFARVASVRLVPFLFGDLDSIASSLRDELRAATLASAEKEREEQERERLLTEIAAHVNVQCDELSIPELRELRNTVVAEAAQRVDADARIERAHQEREREIHRLEVELESIPLEAATDEAHDARQSWQFLQQARSEREPRARLELLKEARRVLPREYRPERF